jgi:large subunit ribosomal protein L3
MRGMKMPGHMGQVQRTNQNLEIIRFEDDNLLLIRGAIPGSKGDYVVIRESKKRPKGWKPHAPGSKPRRLKEEIAKPRVPHNFMKLTIKDSKAKTRRAGS